jgi:5-formyltetrahydrofolate cyclo-ligase
MKPSLREHWKQIRCAIPDERRQLAAENAYRQLSELISTGSPVLSFSSFTDEISTQAINQHFAANRQLVLPKMENNHLLLYLVDDLKVQCEAGQWGLLQPIPKLCQSLTPDLLAFALVPGLAFDADNHRLGYGKGYYDRFLPQLPEQCFIYGLGYLEQQSSEPLPVEGHDFALDAVLLF